MHPLQHPSADELAQVTPDRLLGDREVLGQPAHLDPAVGTGTDEDLPLSLVGVHRPPPFARAGRRRCDL